MEGSINNVRVRLIREEPERQGAFAQTGGKETYQPGHGNGFGIIFNYQPRPSWRFSLGAGQSNQDYYYSFSSHRIDSLSKWRVNFTENLSFWEIPVMVAWLPPVLSGNSTRKIQGRGFRFNLSTGLLTRILQSANNSIERIDNSEPPDRYFNNGVDASGRRKPLQTCLQGGAGLEYHFSPIRIQFQYLSVLGLNNIVRNKFTIISSPLLWDYHHVDNDLALDHTWKLTLSISYNLAFGFKPQTP
ncbi:MAG: hypothetical protein H6581_03835 [Bacteroidia bacterium]|nr:hypothetical protein [Bacteroidia bacterium]